MTGAGCCRKRLDVDEDFLTALGGFDEAESAVVVPGFEGSAVLHEEGDYGANMRKDAPLAVRWNEWL